MMARLFLLVAVTLLIGACENEEGPAPTAAERTYGTAVEAAGALPVPAVAAEAERYAGQTVTVDGRIHGVDASGCGVRLWTDTDRIFRIDARRTADGACAWTLPSDARGIVLAQGPLTLHGDTLRVTTPGIQLTPFRAAE